MPLGIEYGLADISVVGGEVHFPAVLFQPMAADDIASGVARIAAGPPVHGMVGRERFRVDELVRRRLATAPRSSRSHR